jgi:hypothetical protein
MKFKQKSKHNNCRIARWTLTKDQQLMMFNLGTDAKPQMVKINA